MSYFMLMDLIDCFNMLCNTLEKNKIMFIRDVDDQNIEYVFATQIM